MESNRKKNLKAAALKYDPASDSVPTIAAVGQGFVAEKIVEQAMEHGIPVVEDKSTADVLSQFSVGDAIPPALYEAVAQILVFVAEMDTQAGEKYRKLRF